MPVICFHNADEENGYLSNWYPSAFTLKGIDFSSMEQYMMYRKAICFDDDKVAAQILATEDVVYEGLLAKFYQNPELKERLKSTGSAVLAECAVNDRIWGIGLSMRDPDRFDRTKWKGHNLLGYALMMVREKL